MMGLLTLGEVGVYERHLKATSHRFSPARGHEQFKLRSSEVVNHWHALHFLDVDSFEGVGRGGGFCTSASSRVCETMPMKLESNERGC